MGHREGHRDGTERFPRLVGGAQGGPAQARMEPGPSLPFSLSIPGMPKPGCVPQLAG